MRRKDTERITGKKFTIPVLYITQAIGLALGLSPKQLGLQRHFVNVALQGKMKFKKNVPVGATAAGA
jgi:heterodisulfide reductase subunit B